MTKALKMIRGSGNVFEDVGFSKKKAAELSVRADLLIALEEEIKRRRLSQSAMAKLLGVHQPRVSDLMRGRLDRFSIETLIAMLTRLGVQVRVTTSTKRRKTSKKAG